MLERDQKRISIKKEKEILMDDKKTTINFGDTEIPIEPLPLYKEMQYDSPRETYRTKTKYTADAYKELKGMVGVEQEIKFTETDFEYIYSAAIVSVGFNQEEITIDLLIDIHTGKVKRII